MQSAGIDCVELESFNDASAAFSSMQPQEKSNFLSVAEQADNAIIDEYGGGQPADDVASMGPQDLSSLFTMVMVTSKDDPSKLTRRTLAEYNN